MSEIDYPIWAWAAFGAFILVMLGLDLGLLNRKSHTPTYRESLIWSAVWVGLAICFNALIFWQYGNGKGFEFLTGYLIELSLSVDNLFVFLLIFSYFKVPKTLQHGVLFWGVIGALVMRVIMIFLGAGLIELAHWVIYIFGAFLVYTGVKMFREEEAEIEPDKNPIVNFVTKFIPISKHYEGEKFFVTRDGKTVGTLLFLVLVVVEVTDLVFAVDSIPAILGITTDRFIVYTSNVFAILGLRTFFFLLARVIEKFHLLRFGLAFVLAFIGFKMLLPLIGDGVGLALKQMNFSRAAEIVDRYDHLPTWVSLVVVVIALTASILLSLVFPKRQTEHLGDVKIELDDED